MRKPALAADWPLFSKKIKMEGKLRVSEHYQLGWLRVTEEKQGKVPLLG